MIFRPTKQAGQVATGLHLKWPMACLSPRIEHPVPNTVPPWIWFQDYLIPGQQYLFTAKIRLHDPNDKDCWSKSTASTKLYFATMAPNK